jgi:hypothetical protein
VTRILRGAIRAYWRLVPPHRRRRCLFAVSCSNAVYEAAAIGTASALRMLWTRFRACRPGYVLLRTRPDSGGKLVRLADGGIVSLDIMSPVVREQLGAR